MEDQKQSFGPYFRELRNRIPLSQIAKAVGLSTAYLSDMEKERRLPPHAKNLYAICNFMQFTDETKFELIDLAKRGLLAKHGY